MISPDSESNIMGNSALISPHGSTASYPGRAASDGGSAGGMSVGVGVRGGGSLDKNSHAVVNISSNSSNNSDNNDIGSTNNNYNFTNIPSGGEYTGGMGGGSSESKGKEGRDAFQIFEDWLVSSGSKFPKLYLKEYGVDIRGCHTKTMIKADESLIHIPLKCLITVEMGKESKIGKAIIASNIELDVPKHIFLMVFMLEDMRNENSFFKPYYDILPKKMKNMPIFWEDFELKYLEGSFLLFQIRERYNAIVDDYDKICKAVPQFMSIASLNDFMMARMCVSSRNFGVTIGNLRTAVMVPYADMLNHYRPRETKWQYDELVEGFTVVSLKPIMDGAQVFDSYGQKCNHRFLLNYGFSVENNSEPDGSCPNEVPILLELLQVDELYEFKTSAWRRDGCFPSRRIRVAISDNDNTRLMYSMLRVIMADREDIDDMSKRNSLSDNSGYGFGGGHQGGTNWRTLLDTQFPINLKNELRAMARLQFICEEYLSLYPSTFQQDCDRLADLEEMEMYSNKRNACIQVKGEKEILLFYRALSTIMIDLINIITSKDREKIEQLEDIAREMCRDQHQYLHSFVKQNLSQLSRCLHF